MMPFVCKLCNEDVDTSLIHHYMMMHPKDHSEDPIETWPDGQVVFWGSDLVPFRFNYGGEDEG
jgi:hypothetical protein